jgi:cytochrome P450
MSDFTLSDGTFLPTGTHLAANLAATHIDPDIYPSPTTFQPFRFSDIRSSSTTEANKHQMVNTSPEFLAFGHGRHACPGRFFAVNELKAMMCYLVLNYDVRLEDGQEGKRPANIDHRTTVMPNPFAKVLLRRRKVDV